MWAIFQIVKAEMLICISCLKVFGYSTRLGVGCNLDPLGSERVVVIVYVGLILYCYGRDASMYFMFESL